MPVDNEREIEVGQEEGRIWTLPQTTDKGTVRSLVSTRSSVFSPSHRDIKTYRKGLGISHAFSKNETYQRRTEACTPVHKIYVNSIEGRHILQINPYRSP